jgi:menaquinone-dependent protoporphyrinogen oxidase
MRVLVAYASHLGSTQGIAERIAQALRNEDLDVDLSSVDEVTDASQFDAFVIGSAVHAGHWLKPATRFIQTNAAVLARATWLFSSGPIGESAVHQAQPDPAEIAEFRRLFEPRNHIVFAGAFDRAAADAKGNLLERAFSRFVPEGDFRDWPAIENWARDIARSLKEALVTV